MDLPKNCNDCGFYNDSGVCMHDHGKDVVITEKAVLHDRCPIKEDTLDAKRFRVKYRGEDFYLCVSEYEGSPWEVFVEHAINGEQKLQFMMAGWDTATRFISRDLKRASLPDVIRQLDKSSRQKNDLPYIIAEQLRNWV